MKPKEAWQGMVRAGIVSLYAEEAWLIKVKLLIDNAQEDYDQETYDLKYESIKCDLECGDLG